MDERFFANRKFFVVIFFTNYRSYPTSFRPAVRLADNFTCYAVSPVSRDPLCVVSEEVSSYAPKSTEQATEATINLTTDGKLSLRADNIYLNITVVLLGIIHF